MNALALSNSVWVRLSMRSQNSCRMKNLIRKAVAPTRLDTNFIKKALPKAEGFATTIATSKSDHYLRGGACRPETSRESAPSGQEKQAGLRLA
jgi:hypothetical protein